MTGKINFPFTRCIRTFGKILGGKEHVFLTFLMSAPGGNCFWAFLRPGYSLQVLVTLRAFPCYP